MELKRASNNGLALRKVAALTKGEFKGEDFVMISFFVGSDDSDAQEICACKFDLVVASEYFEGLLRSPFTPDGPIRIKHVEPEIFRLVVEFTHLSGRLVTEVNDLEQWLKLAAAADEFLLDDLGQLCTEKLEELINLDNVWTVFSQNHLVKYTSTICEKLLSSKTEECLKMPDFLKIDEIALTKFLNLKQMSIGSEMQLVLACLEFVSRKEDGRALFRRCALPHLRLLTLKPEDDLAKLAPLLEKEEKVIIFFYNLEKDPMQIKNDYLATTSLCKVAEPRNPVLGEDFVPAELVGYRSKILQSDYRHYQYSWTIVLTVETNKAITQSDFLHQLEAEFDDSHLISSFPTNGDWILDTATNIAIKNENGICFQSMDLRNLKLNEFWDHIRPAIFAAKGRNVKVEVTISKTCNFKNVSAICMSGPKKSLEVFLGELKLKGKKFSLVMPTPSCPHLDMVEPLPLKGIDLSESFGRCRDKEDNRICLTCYKVLCGKYIQGHMAQHSEQNSHPLALGLQKLNAWCYRCHDFVDSPALYEAKNAAHLAKFGTEKPWTFGGEIQIE